MRSLISVCSNLLTVLSKLIFLYTIVPVRSVTVSVVSSAIGALRLIYMLFNTGFGAIFTKRLLFIEATEELEPDS